jgi:hypothetical protein
MPILDHNFLHPTPPPVLFGMTGRRVFGDLLHQKELEMPSDVGLWGCQASLHEHFQATGSLQR